MATWLAPIIYTNFSPGMKQDNQAFILQKLCRVVAGAGFGHLPNRRRAPSLNFLV
ncbi:MAG: hypothetical protein QHH44_10570 [Candidatus Saccharicenans sp.]|nr:hypothetical protein [Candidatus Saccharicenans sp.]